MPGIQTHPKPECPECEAEMVLRRPKSHQSWNAFWGCPNFRHGCEGTREIDPDTGKPIIDEIER